MTILIVLIVMFGLAAATLTYTSKLKSYIKLGILPIFILSTMTGYAYFLEEVGKPADRSLPAEATYVFHRVTAEDTIIVWLTDVGDDRLYVIPYSREAAKELEEAKQKSEAGNAQSIKTNDNPRGQQTLSTSDSLDLDSQPETKE